jgi:hypothetical protein
MRLALLTAILLTPLTAQNRHPAQVAGVYEGTLPVKGADARKLTLTLRQDGTAEFRDAATKAEGQWNVDAQDLKLEITGKTEPLAWRIKGNLLTPKEWNHAAYGKKGPILRRPR